MHSFNKLKDLIMSLEKEFDKFYNKDIQAAGTRVRKGMQDLKNIAQEVRIDIQERKNQQ